MENSGKNSGVFLRKIWRLCHSQVNLLFLEYMNDEFRNIFQCLNQVFYLSNIVSGKGYEGKILEKFKVFISLSSIDRRNSWINRPKIEFLMAALHTYIVFFVLWMSFSGERYEGKIQEENYYVFFSLRPIDRIVVRQNLCIKRPKFVFSATFLHAWITIFCTLKVVSREQYGGKIQKKIQWVLLTQVYRLCYSTLNSVP